MRKTAELLLFGSDEEEQELAVSILEECVDLGDTDAMLMLAKCYAHGLGIEHNGDRAEALVSDAAKKGNGEARILMRLISEWEGKERVSLWSLQKCFLNELKYENS